MGLIRFILAASVVAAHAGGIFGLHFVGGKIAVQTFFVISGFYMSLILNEKYTGKGSYQIFISNRFLRLFPIYWATLFCVILFSTITYSSNAGIQDVLQNYFDYFDLMEIPSFLFLIFSNFFLFFQDWIMFMGLNIQNGMLFFSKTPFDLSNQLYNFLFIPQAWTIGVELTFYLIAPFLLRKHIKWIFLLMSCSVILRIYLMTLGLNKDPWTYRFFPSELLFFLLGNISYRFYKKISCYKLNPQYFKISFLIILTYIAAFDIFNFRWLSYVFILLFSILLPFIFIYSQKSKLDYYIGDLSYPMYISHIFIINLILYINPNLTKSLGIISIIFTVIFSILLNEIISKRIERIRQRRVKLIINN